MIDIHPITFVDFPFTLHHTTGVIALGAVVLLLRSSLVFRVLLLVVTSHSSPTFEMRPKPFHDPPQPTDQRMIG